MDRRQISLDHPSMPFSLMELRYRSGATAAEEALAKKIRTLLLKKASFVSLDKVQPSFENKCLTIKFSFLSVKDLDNVKTIVNEACNKQAYNALHKIISCCKRSLLIPLLENLTVRNIKILHRFLLNHVKSASDLLQLPEINFDGCLVKQQDPILLAAPESIVNRLNIAIELGDELVIDQIFQSGTDQALEKIKKSYKELLVTAVQGESRAILKKMLDQRAFLPSSLGYLFNRTDNPVMMTLLLDYGADLAEIIDDCCGYYKDQPERFRYCIQIAACTINEHTMRILTALRELGLDLTYAVLQTYRHCTFNLEMVEKLLELGADAEQLLAHIEKRDVLDAIAPLLLKYCPKPSENTLRALFAIKDVSNSPLYPLLLSHIDQGALASFLPPMNSSPDRWEYYFPDHIDLAKIRLNSLSTDTMAEKKELFAWQIFSKEASCIVIALDKLSSTREEVLCSLLKLYNGLSSEEFCAFLDRYFPVIGNSSPSTSAKIIDEHNRVLREAFKIGTAEEISALVRRGASFTERETLATACWENYSGAIQYFIDQGADLSGLCPHLGRAERPISLVIHSYSHNVTSYRGIEEFEASLQTLIEAKASLTHEDSYGQTDLFVLARSLGRNLTIEYIKFLEASQVDLRFRSEGEYGDFLLFYIVNPETFDYLVKEGFAEGLTLDEKNRAFEYHYEQMEKAAEYGRPRKLGNYEVAVKWMKLGAQFFPIEETDELDAPVDELEVSDSDSDNRIIYPDEEALSYFNELVGAGIDHKVEAEDFIPLLHLVADRLKQGDIFQLRPLFTAVATIPISHERQQYFYLLSRLGLPDSNPLEETTAFNPVNGKNLRKHLQALLDLHRFFGGAEETILPALLLSFCNLSLEEKYGLLIKNLFADKSGEALEAQHSLLKLLQVFASSESCTWWEEYDEVPLPRLSSHLFSLLLSLPPVDLKKCADAALVLLYLRIDERINCCMTAKELYSLAKNTTKEAFQPSEDEDYGDSIESRFDLWAEFLSIYELRRRCHFIVSKEVLTAQLQDLKAIIYSLSS